MDRLGAKMGPFETTRLASAATNKNEPAPARGRRAEGRRNGPTSGPTKPVASAPLEPIDLAGR